MNKKNNMFNFIPITDLSKLQVNDWIYLDDRKFYDLCQITCIDNEKIWTKGIGINSIEICECESYEEFWENYQECYVLKYEN